MLRVLLLQLLQLELRLKVLLLCGCCFMLLLGSWGVPVAAATNNGAIINIIVDRMFEKSTNVRPQV
jgi:hypothetical protein